MNEKVIITGRVAAVVSSSSGFDLADPGKSKPQDFIYLAESNVKDSVLSSTWSSCGYRFIGFAEIKIEVNPVKDMLASAVEALKDERAKIIATAHKETVRLDGEIQKLLAIGYDVEAVHQ